MELSKRKKINIAIAVASIVVFLVVLAMILVCPRAGKKRIDIWAYSQEYNIDEVAKVQKAEGENIRILLMTDIQLWSDFADNKKAFDIMDNLVAKTNPDLIILPGDNVSGLSTDILTLQFIKKMDSYKIPWAPVFGNHDAEGNATLEWQGDRFVESEYCLFSHGPTNLYGVGNYFVNLYQGDEVIYSLALMDNGRYINYGEGDREVYIGYEQIAWYKWNIEGVSKAMGKADGEYVPSMSFTHFAMPEFKEALEKYAVEGEDGRLYVPQGEGEGKGFGSCKYLPGVAPVNSGFFDTAKNMGLTHMFCGHDHENDASITYKGVMMTYGLKTGPSPKYWNDALEYGGTVVDINKDSVEVYHEVIQKA